MALTGRSAAKRAQRLSKTLKDRQRLRERIRLLNANRMAMSSAIAATGQYGLPGVASSGVQGIRASMAVQAQVAHKDAMWDADMASNIQRESDKAKAAAAKFQSVLQLGAIAASAGTEFFSGKQGLSAEVLKAAVTGGQVGGAVASALTAPAQAIPYSEVQRPLYLGSGPEAASYAAPRDRTLFGPRVMASPRGSINPTGDATIDSSVFGARY